MTIQQNNMVLASTADPLYNTNSFPSLDLQFATTKTLNDEVSGQNLVSFTRASTGTYVDSSGVIQTAAIDAPRFDHDPVTGASLGLLVEESRTNYYEASSNITTASGAIIQNLTPTSNAALAPDGTQTADQLVETIASGNHLIISGQAISVVAGESWTVSLFVKPVPGSASNRYPGLRISAGTGSFGSYTVNFDLANNQGYTNQPAIWVNIGVENYPNGWKRLYATGVCQATNAAATYSLGFYSINTLGNHSSGLNYTGDGVSGFYIWGGQIEKGSFPTSYIPTSGSTVTRAADVAEITGTNFSSWYNQTEGTVFTESRLYSLTSTSNFTEIQIDNGTNSNRVFHYIASSDGRAKFQAWGADALTPNIVTPGIDFKHSSSYNSQSYITCLDGQLSSEENTGTQVSLTEAHLGYNHFNNYLNGHIKRLTYYPYRLPDGKLQTITS